MMSKEKVKKLKSIKGEVRGVAIMNFLEFVEKQEGEEAVKEVCRRTQKMWPEVEVCNLQRMDYYPLGLEAVVMGAIKEALGLSDEEIRKLGNFAAKTSLIRRLFAKFFVSLDLMASRASEMWDEYYTVGDLSVQSFDVEKGEIVLVLENFEVNRLHCFHLQGYFSSIVSLVTGSEVECRETKCPFKGDEAHEFVLSWKT